MKYSGYVIKNVHGYYCENNDEEWWFDQEIRFACIFETAEEAQETVDERLRHLPPATVGLTVQEVEFEVLEKVPTN